MFVGDEAFVNPCRPVVIGREVFVTMRSMLVTHNIGHSMLEGFENRFAPIVLEDRAQVGIGTVVYAGCRVGRESIVARTRTSSPTSRRASSRSEYRPRWSACPPRACASRAAAAARAADAGRLSRAARATRRGRAQQARIIARGATDEKTSLVLFVETVDGTFEPPETDGAVVVLTLEVAGDPPPGCAVLDLVARRIYGEGGVVLDSVREFCRKRGIRLEPGPWRYRAGLV